MLVAPTEQGFGRNTPIEVQHDGLRFKLNIAHWPRSKVVDQRQNTVEQITRDRYFGHLEYGVAGVSHDLCANLDHLARWAVGKAREAAFDPLLDRALLDPETAAMLLREENPANRAALARRVKLWMGDQASTVAGMLDGDDDPVKDAVTRGR